jgi:hypothetical protein
MRRLHKTPERFVFPAQSILLAIAFGLSGGCAHGQLPKSMAEAGTGFGYVPLDGLSVAESPQIATCFNTGGDGKLVRNNLPFRPLLQDLPDISVRFAVASLDANGGLTFGPAKLTAEGNTYRAVLDYVNVDAIPQEFYIRKAITTDGKVNPTDSGKKSFDYWGVLHTPAVPSTIVRYEAVARPLAGDTVEFQKAMTEGHYDRVTIPIYVGIGLRITADIRAYKGGISLSSLAAIAAEAQVNSLAGTLTVQTLGVSGKSIATALPMPSKLDQTTVENGVLALGSTRAFIYGANNDGDQVSRTARVVGLYSPIGTDPLLINAIYSALANQKPWLVRACVSPQM